MFRFTSKRRELKLFINFLFYLWLCRGVMRMRHGVIADHTAHWYIEAPPTYLLNVKFTILGTLV